MPRKKPDNHEIPQYYLKGFCESHDPFLWVFERNKPFDPGKKRGKNNPLWTSVSKIGLRADGYGIIVPGEPPDFSFETKLQRQEHIADIPIKKIRTFMVINRHEKEIVVRYIGLMRKRLSRRDLTAKKILNTNINNLPWDYWQRELAFKGNFTRASEVTEAKKQLLTEPMQTRLLRESMIMGYEMSQAALLEMTWNFLITPAYDYFVTSDNPVIFDENQGLAKSPLIFPVGKRVALLAQLKQSNDLSYRNISTEETKKINSIIIQTATKELYSPESEKWICERLTIANP
jgi:hypothetical protein